MPSLISMQVIAHVVNDVAALYTVDGIPLVAIGEVPLSDLGSYARGSIVRGGVGDWEAHVAKTDGAILMGNGTDVASTTTPTFTGVVTFPNTGLHILDTGGDHDLIIKPGTDVSVDRTLTLTTGDADRTITLSGDPTLADWFDQSVKVAATPAFAGLTTTGAVLIDLGADVVGLTIQGDPGQLVNLQEWQHSDTTVGLQVNEVGNLELPTTTNIIGIIEQNGSRVFHTYGTRNIFLGAAAGNFTQTGADNIGIGDQTLESLTSGFENTAVGRLTMQHTTSGRSNMAVGLSSMVWNTTGSFNLAIGRVALFYNQTGRDNVCIGNEAGVGVINTSHSFNTFIGSACARAITTNGDNNVAIGYFAARNLSSGANNILIGYQAADNLTTGDNNIIIGYDIDASAVGVSSELNIGGIIFGDLSVPDVRLGDRAANHVKVDDNGDMSFEGTATVWNDIYFPMSSGRIGGANQPTWAAFQGNTMEYTFAINDYIHLPTQEIAHSYKEGSDICLHVHIVLDGSDVGDTIVNYEIEYTIGDIDETMLGAAIETSGDYTITGGTADRTHLFIEIHDIDGTNLKVQAALKIRFRRIALVGGGNAPSNDPFVLMVGAHIEEDTVGSRTEQAK